MASAEPPAWSRESEVAFAAWFGMQARWAIIVSSQNTWIGDVDEAVRLSMFAAHHAHNSMHRPSALTGELQMECR